jgi:Na+/phosphate symporter
VNLVVASILIALGTSLKLPLSTTYVTFMVAMGTSLADRAWGRESAVYRITGVMAVIGGWFFTAFVAFTSAFILAMAIYFGGNLAILGLVVLSVVILYRTHIIHKRRDTTEKSDRDMDQLDVVKKETILEKCTRNTTENLTDFVGVYEKIIEGLKNEDRKLLLEADDKVNELNISAKKLKQKLFKTLRKLEEDSIETGPYYVQVLDYLREMAHSLTYISKPSFEHVNNNHKRLLDFQLENLSVIGDEIARMFGAIINCIETNDFSELTDIQKSQEEMLLKLDRLRKEQIKLLKMAEAGTRNSMLYFNLIYETRNFLLFSVNLLKAQRDFILNIDQAEKP